MGVGIGHIHVRHAHALTQTVHALIEVGLGELAGLSLGLGKVQVHLGGAHDDKVYVGAVVDVLLGLHHILDGMITGEAVNEVGRAGVAATETGVAGRADGLRETGIAVLRLLHKAHGLPAGFVGEAGAVGHQVAGHHLAGHAVTAHGSALHGIVGAVHHAVGYVVVTGQDHLVHVLGSVGSGEQGIVGLIGTAGGMNAVTAVINEILGDLGALVQIPLIAVGVGAVVKLRVIFAESTFEEQETGLQGHGRELGNLVGALGGGQVGNSEVNVLNHLFHDELTGVAGTVEGLGIGRSHRLVVPRNISEALDLLKVEVGAEETGKALVLGADGRIGAIGKVLQQRVHVAQGAPAPASARRRSLTVTLDFVHKAHLHIGVGIFHEEVRATGQHAIQVHAEGLKLLLSLKEAFGRHAVLGNSIQHVVAAGKGKTGQDGKQEICYLFHRESSIKGLNLRRT